LTSFQRLLGLREETPVVDAAVEPLAQLTQLVATRAKSDELAGCRTVQPWFGMCIKRVAATRQSTESEITGL